MTQPGRVTLELDLDPSSDPIRGLLTDATGTKQEFVGWLGLATAIGELLTPPDPPRP